MTALSVVPATIAGVIGLLQEQSYARSGFGPEQRPEYSPRYAARWYGTFGLAIVWLPLAAPILLLVGCVRAYKMRLTTDPAVELAEKSARTLRREGNKTLAETDGTSLLGILAGSLLAHRASTREGLADVLDYVLYEEPQGAAPRKRSDRET